MASILDLRQPTGRHDPASPDPRQVARGGRRDRPDRDTAPRVHPRERPDRSGRPSRSRSGTGPSWRSAGSPDLGRSLERSSPRATSGVGTTQQVGTQVGASRASRDGDGATARRELEAAEALYGGDFLEEDPYEDWAVPTREEAQATYIGIARSLAASAAEIGDADLATRYYLRILERDPYDESAHLGLVDALRVAGRHGEARRRYGFYAAKMEEIAVEAAPYPSQPVPPARPAAQVVSQT